MSNYYEMNREIGGLNSRMNALLGIQMEMLKVMKATKPVIQAQTTAMDKLGESAKEVGDEIGETQTKLGRFIETKLRATSGAAGIFHKVMYGVPGYFIFKNRMDTLLSGIDKFILQPLSGDKKDGYMSKVLYGVGGSYRKSKDQIENLLKSTAGPQTFASFFEQMEGRNTQLTAVGKGKAAIVNKIKNNSIIKFIKRERGRRRKMRRLQNYLNSKGVSFAKKMEKMVKKANMFFSVSLLLFAKLAFVVFAGLVALFLLVKILKALGVSGKTITRLAKNIFEIAKAGLSLIGIGLTGVYDGIMEMYNAIFNDGSFSELISGFVTTIEGLMLVGAGLLVVLLSPLFGLIVTALGAKVEDGLGALKQKINKIIIALIAVGAFVALLPILAAGVISMPFIIAGAIIAGIGLLIAAINPFANGGVTKSGLSLVGERGPELVRLPKGSRVHSNQESRKMVSSGGNNITVNINGRVGSSDSELRIIAQKVGKMINKEINRTTSSRSLGA